MEYLIYASLVIITILCLWVLIALPKNYLLKSILIPVMLLIAVSTWYTYNDLMGYGTTDKPTETVMVEVKLKLKNGRKKNPSLAELKQLVL